ncbi:type 1 glutamine amidotransferase [Aneurinibacillus terranovensis]|uniref:type 1 glutamine amidotransferase n=1 Tax=Aneurinibacillus terranovensis TaxID=278991 RepID=UPI00041D34C7|nr:glutamine amidotransferase [Aneurinibacillus terranovensis]
MQLTIYHFFPKKLNLYADRGNIIALQKRCEWRSIAPQIIEVDSVEEANVMEADIVVIGGGSDREQSLVTEELTKIQSELKSAIEDGVSCLAVCGGYQFLGDYYQLPDGSKLPGLELLDFYTVSKPARLIGNILLNSETFGNIVGFENHGGRTYHSYKPLGEVVKGHGNNGEDGKEGIHYKNLVGTYLHGPLLPKNPQIADYLISNALERKYGNVKLFPLDDQLENTANKLLWERELHS